MKIVKDIEVLDRKSLLAIGLRLLLYIEGKVLSSSTFGMLLHILVEQGGEVVYGQGMKGVGIIPNRQAFYNSRLQLKDLGIVRSVDGIWTLSSSYLELVSSGDMIGLMARIRIKL